MANSTNGVGGTPDTLVIDGRRLTHALLNPVDSKCLDIETGYLRLAARCMASKTGEGPSAVRFGLRYIVIPDLRQEINAIRKQMQSAEERGTDDQVVRGLKDSEMGDETKAATLAAMRWLASLDLPMTTEWFDDRLSDFEDGVEYVLYPHSREWSRET